MHISQLIIQGFKSYKKKVVIDFDRGHNCIVGKNGSGKSNILSAIAFVLSNKFKTLRQEERRQLLHDAGVSGCQSAFVEIIFDNSDKRIPNKETFVSIKRVIAAKKDEYFLNGNHSSKKDIQNLLESAGIALGNQYFIVEQGSIARFIRGKDNERLELIREIAGTRVYDDRTKESLKLMNVAKNDQQKVNGVLNYLNIRLQELEEEKQELSEFEKLERKRRAMEYWLYEKEQALTLQKLEEMNENNDQNADEKLIEMQAELKSVEENIIHTQHSMDSCSKKLQNLKNFKTKDELSVKSKFLQTLNLNIDKCKKAQMENDAKYEKSVVDLENVLENIESAENDLQTVNEVFIDLEVRDQKLKEKLKNSDLQLNDLYEKQQRLSKFRNKNQRNKYLSKEIAKIEQELELDTAQLEIADEQILKTEKELENKELSLVDCQSKEDELKKELQRMNSKSKEWMMGRDELQNNRKHIWREESELKKRREEIEIEIDRGEKDLRNAMAFEMYKTYKALKTMLNEPTNDPEIMEVKRGVYGPLIELFSAENENWIAIEGAAQNKLFYWVVDNDSTAALLLNILKKRKIGRVTCMPLNRISFRERAVPQSSDVIPIMDKLQFDEEQFPNLKRALLQVFGNSLIVRDLDVGYNWATKERYQCITIEGDCVNSFGGMDGGFNERKYCKIRYVSNINYHENEMRENLENMEILMKKKTDNDLDINANENKIRNNESSIRRLNSTLNVNERQVDDIRVEIEQLQNILQSEFAHVHRNCEQRILSAKEKIKNLKKEMKEKLTNTLTKKEKEKMDEITEEMEEIKEELSANVTKQLLEQKSKKTDIEFLLKYNLNRQKCEYEKILKTCKIKITEFEQELDMFENRLKIENESYAELKTDFDEHEKNSVIWRKDSSKSEKKMNDLKDKRLELIQEIEEEGHANERYAGKYHSLQESNQELIRRIRNLGSLHQKTVAKYSNKRANELKVGLKEVHKHLNAYKNVNKKALTQFNSFLAERENLETRNELRKDDSERIYTLINHLDKKKDDGIVRTFHGINANFKKAFKEIVMRGTAELVLFQREMKNNESEDEEEKEEIENRNKKRKRKRRKSSFMTQSNTNSYEMNDESSGDSDDEQFENKYCGIGISVSFVDDSADAQRVTSMQELSGGQQTVVALALIFAIQRCLPSPFYIFDEIDAALDDQYRRAVADILESQKGSTQFITTTFRRELLVACDKCFVVEFRNKISTVKEEEDINDIDISKYQ